MDDKTFELLNKMYGEFTNRFDDVGKDVKSLKNDVVRIEKKLDTESRLYLMVTSRYMKKLWTFENYE